MFDAGQLRWSGSIESMPRNDGRPQAWRSLKKREVAVANVGTLANRSVAGGTKHEQREGGAGRGDSILSATHGSTAAALRAG